MRSTIAHHRNLESVRSHPDYLLIVLTLVLISFGVLMVFDASVVEAFHELGDQWYYIKNQSQFALIGLACGLIAYLFPLRKLEPLSLPIIGSAFFFLLIVLIPGIGTKVQGARRWLDIGPVHFQPSEYTKLAAILYFSAWFSKPRPARSFAVILASLIFLIMLEPDMGTALVICGIAGIMYFLSGASLKKIAKLGLAAVITLVVLILMAPYRLDRVKTFFNPTHDPLGVSYHSRQILISLGSGGFFGTGLGRSRQKFQYLPEASTDSIFAVVGEEFGYLGAIVLMATFTVMIFRTFSHAKHIQNPFIANVTAGIGGWLAVQVLLNLMAMVGIVPLTGIPLPLISYGGSSLVMMLVGIGLVINASKYTKHDHQSHLKRTSEP